jgi:3-hydroxyacyl-CoA dehydrogenase
VGLDTTVNVANNLVQMQHDESRAAFEISPIMASLMEKSGWVIKRDRVFTRKPKMIKAKPLSLLWILVRLNTSLPLR